MRDDQAEALLGALPEHVGRDSARDAHADARLLRIADLPFVLGARRRLFLVRL